MRGKGCRHDPFVVGLMQRLIDTLVVKAAVDPVDAEIGEADKEGELQPVVPDAWALLCCIVELRVAAYFSKEPGRGEDCHDGKGDVGLLHLKSDLVLEVSRVGEGRFVKNKEVRCGREDVVDEDPERPAIVVLDAETAHVP